MITTHSYRKGQPGQAGFDPAAISDVLAGGESFVWLDAEDPTDAELAMLEEEFGLHPLVVEDAKHKGQRPKVEVFDDYYFLVLYGFSVAGRELREHEIHLFVAERFLITLRYAPAYTVEAIVEQPKRHPRLAEERGFFLYSLLDHVVDGYFEVIDHFEEEAEQIEDEVFADDPAPGIQQRIYDLKKKLVAFRRRVTPLRNALNVLQTDEGIVTASLRAYYRDVADHVIRALEFVDSARELLTTALEAHLSQVSNRMNMVMKQVTSWGAIILVPTLVAGIYGMNFRHMPELNWLLGYPLALVLMAISSFTLFRAFRRRGWL